MPIILRISKYVIYFWSNANNPREFIHVHVSVKQQASNSTKLFITSDGEIVVYNNNSKIPEKYLNVVIEVIKNNIPEIEEAWFEHFGEIHYIR